MVATLVHIWIQTWGIFNYFHVNATHLMWNFFLARYIYNLHWEHFHSKWNLFQVRKISVSSRNEHAFTPISSIAVSLRLRINNKLCFISSLEKINEKESSPMAGCIIIKSIKHAKNYGYHERTQNIFLSRHETVRNVKRVS